MTVLTAVRGPRARWWLAATVAALLLLGPVAGIAVAAVGVWDHGGAPTPRRVLLLAALVLALVAAGWLAVGVPDPFAIGATYAFGPRGWLDAMIRGALAMVAIGVVGGPPGMRARPDPERPRGTEPVGSRLPEVDRLRAVAIVTVVLIHTLPFRAPTTGHLDWWLGDLTRFAVPVLFLVSGWLVPARPVGLVWLRRRLTRLLVPYLTASTVMLLVTWASPLFDRPPVVRALLMGDAVGIYYFVFALVVLTLLVPLLQRLSRRGQLTVFVLAAVASLVIEIANLSIYLHNHLPLTWLPYLLGGMLLRPHRDRLRQFADHGAAILVAPLGVLVVALALVEIETPARQALTWAGIWVVGATLLLWSLGGTDRASAVTTTLSRGSYPIFLYHVPIVAGLVGTFGTSALSGRPLVVVPLTIAMLLGMVRLVHEIWPEQAGRVLGG